MYVDDFITDLHCPSLLKAARSEEQERVVGPPTSAYYECGNHLVQYHQCIIVFDATECTSGFEYGQKITLRIECTNLYKIMPSLGTRED